MADHTILTRNHEGFYISECFQVNPGARRWVHPPLDGKGHLVRRSLRGSQLRVLAVLEVFNCITCGSHANVCCDSLRVITDFPAAFALGESSYLGF